MIKRYGVHDCALPCMQGVIELLGSIRIMRSTTGAEFDKPTRIERKLMQQLAALRQARTPVRREHNHWNRTPASRLRMLIKS